MARRAVGQEDLAAADDRLLALLLGGPRCCSRTRRGSPGRGRARRRTPPARRSPRRCRPAFLRGACAPGWAIGIRPVPTWKSTAAAPDADQRRAELVAVLGLGRPRRSGRGRTRSRRGRARGPRRPARRRSAARPGLRGRERGVQAAGQQQAESRSTARPGERAAAVPREPTCPALRGGSETHISPCGSGEVWVGYLMR